MYVGRWINTEGVATIKGGEAEFQNITIGSGKNTKGTMTVQGGTVKCTNEFALGKGAGSNSTLIIDGGTFDLRECVQNVYVGNVKNATATMEIKSGTFFSHRKDFVIGHDNSVAHFIVSGGTYGEMKDGFATPYNFVIRGTTSNEKIGTLVELTAGELNTQWFSLGQGDVANGVCTFNMTGGTLNVGGKGEGNFRVGHQDDGTANISGGQLNIVRTIMVGTGAGGDGILNVIGSGSKWQAASIDVLSGSSLNFIAGKLGVNADGTAIDAVSTINVSGNALLNGAFSINMSDYNYDGVMYVKGDVNQTMINAGSLTWNPNSITVSDGWILDTTGTSAVLTLDETKIAFADVTSGSAFASGTLGSEGWVKLTGNANDTVTLSMIYGGEGDAEDFVAWLQESLSESQKDVTISSTFDTISFGNLKLDENGLGYLNYDLSAFNLQSGANMSFSNVPEPSTWGLMLVGLGVGFFFRKRKETVKA
ncbi:MAG: PEP-CTERM sorting domain-containing protein [Planctomycetia bacterium]|nr:PEP-CTERM sorting domain-containing protein [Planctomycetia bacterium]